MQPRLPFFYGLSSYQAVLSTFALPSVLSSAERTDLVLGPAAAVTTFA
jgi:hypothetical protein